MLTQKLFLMIGSLITINTCAMEQLPKNIAQKNEVPSLRATAINAIVAGYGNTDGERQKSSAQFINTLHARHNNGSLQIEDSHITTCKNKHIGTHGWGMDTGNGKEFICTKHGDFIKKVRITRSFNVRTNFLIKQNNEKNSYITSNRKNIHIIDMQSGVSNATLTGHAHLVHCCTTTHHDNIIVSGSNDTTIKIWNLDTNKAIQTLSGHQNFVACIAAERDIFSSADWHPLLKIWDLPSGTCLHTYPTKEVPFSIMMHGAMLYSGLHNGKIISIDPRSGTETHKWGDHQKPISCLIPCKHNNTLIYSASWDQTIKQWDLRNLSACIKKLHKKNNVNDATYNIQNIYENNNGKKIFSSDLNNIYIWDVSQNKPQLLTKTSTDNRILDNCMAMNDDETELHVGIETDAIRGQIKTFSPNCTFDELNEILNKK